MKQQTKQNYTERTITIGNTEYLVIAKQKENAKQTAFDVTKRLLTNSIPSFIQELKISNANNNDSLNGCDSGGKK